MREPRKRQQEAAAARNYVAPVERSANIFDMPLDEFQGALVELRSQGLSQDRIDDLMRQYRAQSSPFAGINEAATASQGAIADAGRSTVAGGLLSKPEGATGMDAVRGLQFEGMNGLLGALSLGGKNVDAAWAAAKNLIPQADMDSEALGMAGIASLGGGAVLRRSDAAFNPARRTDPNLLAANANTQGGLLATAASDTLNPSEQMARRILDMRAAGRAGEVTDEMMAAADPQYMFNNTPLPMDEASRLARAGEAYAQAAEQAAESYDNVGIRTVEDPAFLTTESVRWDDGNRIPDEFLGGTSATDAASPTAFTAHPNTGVSGNAPQGTYYGDYSGILQSNRSSMGEDSGEIVMQNPELAFARSRFARFDPEFAHLANLNAANIDPMTGLFGAMAAEEQRRRRNAP